MSDEQHVYELEVIVRGHDKPDTIISREYVTEKASTDGAAAELWEGVTPDRKAKMRPVNDGS